MAFPRVSVIIPAFNLARYLPAALDSALAQEDPGGPVEVIVVDDGSEDETPQVLDRYAGGVKVIRQPNRGFVAAVDRGLQEARGEFVALLDADDEWPLDRLRRHVAILEHAPAVGLVHGDMELISADGATLHPSFFGLKGIAPTDGRVLGRLLANNFVSGGASTFRASLLPALTPIGPDAAYPDWWIAACIAAVAEVVFDGAVANRYRSHGSNMGLDATPERLRAIYRMELPWRRWMLCQLADDDSVSASDIAAAVAAWQHALSMAASDPSLGAAELSRLDDEAIAAALAATRAREGGAFPALPSPPLIAFDARPRLTIAWLEEVTAHPALLRAFAQETAGDGDASLAVLVPRGTDVADLVSIVESDELLSGEGCDISAIPEPVTAPARALLAARACSRLSALCAPHPYSELDCHGAVERAGAAL